MEVQETINYTEDDEEVKYNRYNIIFTIVQANSLNQIKLEVYFTDDEAYRAFKLLNNKIDELVTTKKPISISFTSRNVDGVVVRHGITGIVCMEHNIPQFREVLD